MLELVTKHKSIVLENPANGLWDTQECESWGSVNQPLGTYEMVKPSSYDNSSHSRKNSCNIL
jgi:hypothetical protein